MLGLRVLAPLVNRQAARGMATVKDIQARLNPVENMRKVIQSKYLTEVMPPTPAEIPKAIRDLRNLFKNRTAWKDVTVREACLNALVTTEVICWFFVGECIGKGTLIGYQV